MHKMYILDKNKQIKKNKKNKKKQLQSDLRVFEKYFLVC
jgi:hypothetical protein